MATLTLDQNEFLEYHNIPTSWTFDASGMKKSKYHDAMSDEEKFFAYGVTPCKKADHSLRTRTGTCIQCFPASISYTLRHYGTAHIYIAGSIKNRLIKVGSTSTVATRICSLNVRTGYADTTDWKLLSHIYVENAGAVEFSIHKLLQPYLTKLEYWKTDDLHVSKECFSCSYSVVKKVLLANAVGLLEEQNEVNQYEFE